MWKQRGERAERTESSPFLNVLRTARRSSGRLPRWRTGVRVRGGREEPEEAAASAAAAAGPVVAAGVVGAAAAEPRVERREFGARGRLCPGNPFNFAST